MPRKGREGSFYRTWDVRTWGSSDFRNLPPAPPSARTLLFYLATGDVTNQVPGLFIAGPAQLAEALGWPLTELLACFAQLETAGFARADWSARVVWLPRRLAEDPPDNPNVVKGWLPYLDALPECALKDEAIEAIDEHLQARGPGFLEALRKRFPKPSGEPSPEPSEERSTQRYRKQEQEQEQELTPPLSPPLDAGGTERASARRLRARRAPERRRAFAPLPNVAPGEQRRHCDACQMLVAAVEGPDGVPRAGPHACVSATGPPVPIVEQLVTAALRRATA